jgi:hypothetical protein
MRPIRRGARVVAGWGWVMLAMATSQAGWADEGRPPVVLDSTGNVSGTAPAVTYDSENGVSGGAPATVYETAPFKDDRVAGPKGSRDTVIGLKPPKNRAPGQPAVPATPAAPGQPAGAYSGNDQQMPFVPYINVTPGRSGHSGSAGHPGGPQGHVNGARPRGSANAGGSGSPVMPGHPAQPANQSPRSAQEQGGRISRQPPASPAPSSALPQSQPAWSISPSTGPTT